MSRDYVGGYAMVLFGVAVIALFAVILIVAVVRDWRSSRKNVDSVRHCCPGEREMPIARWVLEKDRYWRCRVCKTEWYVLGGEENWDGYWHYGMWVKADR